jgi:probable F420-dependent oxidoreductase
MHIGAAMFFTDYSMSPGELGKALEERGFESVWAPEHSHIPLTRKSPFPGGGELPKKYYDAMDPFVALMAAAAATKKLKVGTGVCLVNQRDPIQTAKLVSTIDQLSDGRFLFGVGNGWNQDEMENHGTAFDTRHKLVRERIEAMKVIWTKSKAEYHGDMVSFDPMMAWPKPAQKPHPPIWVAGRKEPAMKRAATYADGWIPYMYTPEMLHESLEKIHQFGKEAGRDMSKFRPGIFMFASVYPDRDEAREQAAKALGKNYAQDFSKIAGRYALYGNPEDCRKRLKEYIDAGARTVLVSWACRQNDIEQNMRLVAEEVAPAFR